MGERTNDLRDIQYCKVEGTPVIRLFFSRIKTSTCRDNLQQFVWKLDALVHAE